MRAIFSRRGNLRPALLLVLVIGFVVALQVTPAFAQIASIQVTIQGDEDANNSDCSLREAIIAANNNADYNGCTSSTGWGPAGSADIITFAPGVNTITLSTALAAPPIGLPVILEPLTIQGPVTVTKPTGSYRIFTYAIGAGDSYINNVTLTNGGASGSGGITFGGCVYVDINSSVHLHVNGSSFSSCRAQTFGGAIYMAGNTQLTVSGSTFSNNIVTGAGLSGGGAIAVEAGTTTIVEGGSVFTGNSAQEEGGAIFVGPSASSFTLRGNSYLSGNSAQVGGAVSIQSNASFDGDYVGFYNNDSSDEFGSAVYTVGGTGLRSCHNCCIVGNLDIAVAQQSNHDVSDFTGNWWGSEWGPNIPPAGASTGSGTSTGDSISGDGTTYIYVDVDDYGTESTGPVAGPAPGWLPEPPVGINYPANQACRKCVVVSSVTSNRICTTYVP